MASGIRVYILQKKGRRQRAEGKPQNPILLG
jgi:hypothetical protein